jgi:predicted DsbA family dithiol-disulfide isomerase
MKEMLIPVAHDFTCPWCWIMLFQTEELTAEFGVRFDWRGYELWPEELAQPESVSPPPKPLQTDRPATPTRMQLAYAAQRIERPTSKRPDDMNSHNAHEAVEFAKLSGVQDQVIARLYRAYWEDGKIISDLDVIAELTADLIEDQAGLREAIETKRFKDQIIGFDDPAYATGVYNVPTFFIGGERYAEQPITVIRKAIQGQL